MDDTTIIQDLSNQPPDVTYTDAHAVTDGELIDLIALGLQLYFDGEPINRASRALVEGLAKYNSGETESEQVAAAYQALLGFIVDGAVDNAEEGERRGYLLESRHPIHALGGKPVWMQPNGSGWTAMLPEDY